MHTSRRLAPKIIVVAVAAGLFALVAILLTPVPVPAQPVISWTPSALAGEVAGGNSKTVTVSFTSSETFNNVEVRVVPELQPFVQVNPTTFAVIPAGQPRTLNVTFSASNSSPFGTFDGTIQLRQRNNLARPLPVTVLVTVVPLPPDPGAAGKATLAGIDSDNDGVRDDVQRYIALTYPGSAKTRAVLTQATVTLQAALLSTNKETSIQIGIKRWRAVECLVYIRGAEDAYVHFGELRARILNTDERSRAYIKSGDHLSGIDIPRVKEEGERKLLCDFDPDAMEN
jgi:hypothetical protein